MSVPIEISVGTEMTYEDCQTVDGGGTISLGVKFTIGGFVSSAIISTL